MVVGRTIARLIYTNRIDSSTSRWRWRGVLVLCCALTILLGGATVRQLIWTPERTSLLVLASSYEAPWDINPWVAENVGWLSRLDHRNLTVAHVGSGSELVDGRWTDFENAVRRASRASQSGMPLMVYVGLHGAVDDQGKPCLIVQGARSHQTATWLPLEGLLQRAVQCLEPHQSIVLFFESGRQPNALAIGGTSESFHDAIRKLLADRSFANEEHGISIILSNSDNEEPSTASTAGHGDSFSRALAEGLSGAADQSSMGGNADRLITLEELASYIETRVASLSQLLRNRPQRTALITLGSPDQQIAWSLRHSLSTDLPQANLEELEYRTECERLWIRYGGCKQRRSWLEQPGLWARVTHQLHAIESATFGGAAVRLQLPHWIRSAKQNLTILEQGNQASSDVPTGCGLSQALKREHAKAWHTFAEQPDWTTAQRLSLPVKFYASTRSPLNDPFLATLSSRSELECWAHPELLKRLAAVHLDLQAIDGASANVLSFDAARQQERQLLESIRRIEDLLLCETPLKTIEEELTALEAASREWLDSCRVWQELLDAQATAYSELPMLVPLVDALADGEVAGESSQAVSDRFHAVLEALEQNVHVFADAMSSNSQEQSTTKAPVDHRRLQQELRQKLMEQWDRLDSPGTLMSPGLAWTIERFCHSPWLPIEFAAVEHAVHSRLSLREKLIEFDRKSFSKQVRHNANQLSTSKAPSFKPKPFVHQSDWLMRMVSIDGAKSAERSDVPRQVRELIDRLVQEDGLIESSSKESTQGDLGDPLNDLVRRDALSRMACSMTGDSEIAGPAEMYRNVIAESRELSQVEDVLDSFWNLPRVDDRPWFSLVGQQLLECAGDQRENSHFLQYRSLQQKRIAMSELIKARDAAALRGLALTAQCLPQIDEMEPLLSICQVQPGEAVHGLPRGVGGLGIQSYSRTNWYPISIGRDMSAQQGRIAIGPTIEQSRVAGQAVRSEATAKAYFRGHEYGFPFELLPEIRAGVVAEIATRGGATVTVDDRRPRNRARTFVLDCSASMNKREDVEGLRSAEGGDFPSKPPVNKLDAAKVALVEMLQRLRGRNDQVGVMLYGHRVAAGKPEQGILLQNRYYAKFPFPHTLQPYEDVEAILPVGRFGDAQLSTVLEHLDSIVPWGQSPLFVALLEAVQSTQRLGHDVQHDIIVISDGENYQFNPPTARRVTSEQVIEAALRLGVRIHIVGFGVAQQEVANATQQYQALATATGGQTSMELADSVALLERLQSLVEPEPVRLELASGQVVQGQTGQPISIAGPVPDNMPLWLDYRNERRLIPVSSRSAIQLLLGNDGRLTSAELQGGPRVQVPLIHANQIATPFQISIEQFRLDDHGQKWRVGMTRLDGDVPQRPRYVLVEVRPRTGSRSGERPIPSGVVAEDSLEDQVSYILADAAWAPDTPQPILEFSTTAWPSRFPEAELLYYCSDEPPASRASFALADFDSDDFRDGQGKFLESLGIRVQIQKRDDGFTIMLLHSEATTVKNLIPQVQGIEVTSVERRFHERQRMSIHRFQYPASSNLGLQVQSIREAGRVEIGDWSQFRRRSLMLTRPATIPVLISTGE